MNEWNEKLTAQFSNDRKGGKKREGERGRERERKGKRENLEERKNEFQCVGQ